MLDTTAQASFTFDVRRTADQLLAPPGTWSAPQSAIADCRARLEAARTSCVPGPAFLSAAINRGVDLTLEEIAVTQRCRKLTDRDFIHLREVPIPATTDFHQAFANWCMSGASTTHTVRIRAEVSQTSWAVFHASVGTLILRAWSAGVVALHYRPDTKCPFRDTYKDCAPRYPLSDRIWGPLCCAQRIGESPRHPARVRSFAYTGRSYINRNGYSCGSYRECEAWSLLDLSDWHLPTFSYTELLAARNLGTVEPGCDRGLLVLLRDRVCVLDQCTVFFDDQASHTLIDTDDDDPVEVICTEHPALLPSTETT